MSTEHRLITDEVVFREVSNRFATDTEFRAQLSADAGAILAALGIEVPTDVLVRVEREEPAIERFVVYGPESSELADADLENVAGGIDPTPFKLTRSVVFQNMIAYAARW
jgi:hypothetical protein